MNLSQTTQEVLKNIQDAEKRKDYFLHVDPKVNDKYYPIDQDFSYENSKLKKMGYFLLRNSIIRIYAFYANRCWFHTKINGKENVRNITTGAIVTCNHVNKLDAIVLNYALKHKMRYTVAEFNNMKGRLGSYMRAFGILPIPASMKQMNKFSNTLEENIKSGYWISFFPESAEWWCYEKPRPYQMGAFHYAAKFKIPILPVFITFIKTGKKDKNGIEKRKYVVNILPPIYPANDISLKENKLMLHKKNEEMIWDCYRKFYYKEIENPIK